MRMFRALCLIRWLRVVQHSEPVWRALPVHRYDTRPGLMRMKRRASVSAEQRTRSNILEGLSLPPREVEPTYQSLARSIRERIQSGQLRPGDLLPSKRELAAALHISVATVRHA